jgi:DNA-binding NarL/FixJ family response regulator
MGYIIKQDCGSLPSSVRAVASGQAVFGGKVVEKLPDLLNRKERFDPSEFDITPKELEVIELVADGLSNKEIAEKMFLGEGTVRNMVSSILTKLDLRDRTQLACFYYQKMV